MYNVNMMVIEIPFRSISFYTVASTEWYRQERFHMQ